MQPRQPGTRHRRPRAPSFSGYSPPVGALTLEPGTVFAEDYRVVERLSEGGQGALYVVEQLSTKRRRALKLMLPELVTRPALRRRFEAEARIGARIKSDHVVDVIASGVEATTGTPWLVMEEPWASS